MTNKLDLAEFSGKWAAILDEEIVASANSPEELMLIIEEKNIEKEDISIILVPEEGETHHILILNSKFEYLNSNSVFKV